MSQILAIESSSEQCSAAILSGADVLQSIDTTPRAHAQNLLPMVKSLLAEAGTSLSQVDAIAVGQGPGSFTGLRIAMGVAQGLAFGADLPVIGVSSINAMAHDTYYSEVGKYQQILAILDARMEEFYWGLFDVHDENLAADAFAKTNAQLSDREFVLETIAKNYNSETGKFAFIGQGLEYFQQDNSLNFPLDFIVTSPSAKSVALLAENKLRVGEVENAQSIEPLYLRNSVAWKKRTRIRNT